MVPENFGHNAYSFARDSAWPHTETWQPIYVSAVWGEAEDDDFFGDSLRYIADLVHSKAMEVGVSRPDEIVYSNWATGGTPVESLYGKQNVVRLAAIAKKYDPHHLRSLTGGYALPA